MHAPRQLDGMNWLPNPDPHVHVFDMLVSDGKEHRWLARLREQPATVDHLRTSLLDCFPFSKRATQPTAATERLWDRHVVSYSLDASMSAKAAASLPLIRSLGSLALGASNTSARRLVFELTDVSVTVAERLVLLGERLERSTPEQTKKFSRELYNALTTGRIYVVIAAYFTQAIRIYDSTAKESKLRVDTAASDAHVDINAELAQRSTLLFERSAEYPPAAFGIKVMQVGYNDSQQRLFLGKPRHATMLSGENGEQTSDLTDNVLQLAPSDSE